ncbi:Cytochrome P450 monooxygenase hkm5 [Exophiala dermatitidis]|uniref:Cytochrome P450 oxidoreductase n=1 Tax=Exophiala dermatitidis (strain ATCC 34100 / CBS 525.76 / NIH/UT8656) TaxID=858893 RepID=H6BS74_EXODN|nr:cytochrome P450 oxidoreductase [Exophiala dermatitidis NIH/UT8656]EHY54129.1 cytochrome P450 oxidoreductase [Exophiala dermatitidis NIH/UT8656]
MAISTVLLAPLLTHSILSLILLPVIFLASRTLYRISRFHPLAHIPGPLLPRVSSLWLTYHAWIGDEASITKSLHDQYGPVIRTGPNSVDISDGAALGPIYNEKGGFAKTDFYANFDIDGHKSIFSETDPLRRAPRAKAVAALFSTTNLRQGQDIIYKCVDRLVDRLSEGKGAKKRGKPLNVLNLTRGLAVDAVTSYLLGNRYGALDESVVQEEKRAVKKEVSGTPDGHDDREMSASGMVNCFVAVGRFWYLPTWAFKLVESFDLWWNAEAEVSQSLSLVDEYVASVVRDAEAAILASKSQEKQQSSIIHPLTSYPARLLQAGFTPSEVRAQCKDLVFAGTDSTGMNLATILFQLARNPEYYKKLREEILAAGPSFDDLQSLPYLRGVVKEGLRLSMANPSRLPRVVPKTGWTFKDTYFPPGTVVGCTPYVLHLNADVFEEPYEFKPERWLQPSDEMTRDAIPFGLGSRQCIARNLANVELFCAVEKVVRADVLSGAKTVKDKVEIIEWFNSKVIGERIDLVWE